MKLRTPQRHYICGIADSSRWSQITLRPDDVIISTPSKCGTTWTQAIVGMLIFGRTELGLPMGMLSPWIDMVTRDISEVRDLLEAQLHRRFVKTHTALDGIPWSDAITYFCVVRHPLDAALSNRDHGANMDEARLIALREAAGSEHGATGANVKRHDLDPGDYLRAWIEDDTPSGGTGATNLADFAHSVASYWAVRERPNVRLFHYSDMQADLPGQIERMAGALNIPLSPRLHADIAAAVSLDAMRARAADLAPEAHLGVWRDDRSFFRQGGRRDWAEYLSGEEIASFERRFADAAGADAAAWALSGGGE